MIPRIAIALGIWLGLAIGAFAQVCTNAGTAGIPVFSNTTGACTVDATSQIPGTTTNDNASSGNIGEYVSSTVASGSAVSLTNATPANITSISLTAGDWDVSGIAAFTFGATTSLTVAEGGPSSTTATLPAPTAGLAQISTAAQVPVTPIALGIPAVRFSLSTTTTIFLVGQCNFTVSTCGGYGLLSARRVR